LKKAQTISNGASRTGTPRRATIKNASRNAERGGKPTKKNAPVYSVASGNGKTTGEMVRKSNSWRDNYNPLRQLTIQRLMALFEQAERGAYSEIQLILRKAEKRFPILKGFVEKLVSSIEELEWDVKVMAALPEGVTPAMAEAQRKFLRGRYDLLKNLSNTFGQIALGEIHGYTVLQKHRYDDGGPNDGAVAELYWIEPWCWSREGFYGDFYYNEQSRFGIGLGTCQASLGEKNRIGSVDLPREEFVIREVDSPIYEIALIAFVNWLMARKDWAAFVEIFGLPNAVVIMPPNIPPGSEAEYQASAEKVADGVSGAMPNGSDIKFPTASQRGDAPFKGFCDAQESDVVMAGTGGQLTMLSMPTGIGKGASEEHDGAWQKIAALKARRINETLNRDFDLVELAAEFPGQPVCVYFELSIKDKEDVGMLADTVVKMEGVNLQTDEKEISERTGLKLKRVTPVAPAQPDAAAKADQGIDKRELGAAVKNREGTDTAVDALLQTLEPVRDSFNAILKIDDPVLQETAARALLKNLPHLQTIMIQNKSVENALMPDLVAAFMSGLKPATKS
jgi:phage gp29-like protein